MNVPQAAFSVFEAGQLLTGPGEPAITCLHLLRGALQPCSSFLRRCGDPVDTLSDVGGNAALIARDLRDVLDLMRGCRDLLRHGFHRGARIGYGLFALRDGLCGLRHRRDDKLHPAIERRKVGLDLFARLGGLLREPLHLAGDHGEASPASPARTASIVALRASSFVWAAMFPVSERI